MRYGDTGGADPNGSRAASRTNESAFALTRASTDRPPAAPGRIAARRAARAITTIVVLLASLLGAAGVASADPSADDWYRLRVCESGNNYAINTGNGYYGAYQFDLGTWRSVGGTGLPSQASPATQDALALQLWRSRGWGPWACARIIGLRDSPVSAPAPVVPPTGFIDSVTTNGPTATVAGWAFDPNQSGTSIPIDVYVNGELQRGVAGGSRDDVNAAFGIGGQHGYQISMRLRDGLNGFCVYAIGAQQGNDTLLGCRNVTVSSAPRGFLDSASVSGSTVTVAGWAVDPSQTGTSIPVHVYVNGQFQAAAAADGARDDVNAVWASAASTGTSSRRPCSLARTRCVCSRSVSIRTPIPCWVAPPCRPRRRCRQVSLMRCLCLVRR